MPAQAEKARAFADLHAQADAFIIPNPWDGGSARLLQGLGLPSELEQPEANPMAKIDRQLHASDLSIDDLQARPSHTLTLP